MLQNNGSIRSIYGLRDDELSCFIGVLPADDKSDARLFLKTLVEGDNAFADSGHYSVYCLGYVDLDDGRLRQLCEGPAYLSGLAVFLGDSSSTDDDRGSGSDDLRSDSVDAVKADG